jgi:hypothetical protein
MNTYQFRPTYFEIQKKSRRARPVGEVFACKIRGMGYVHGRVIRDDCAFSPPYHPRPWKREKGVYLVYFYKGVSHTSDVMPSLSVNNLLFAPCKTSQHGWDKGYFLPVAVLPIRSGEMFPMHCFTIDPTLFVMNERLGPRYFTEYGEPLNGPLEYCIEDGLYGCSGIEKQIAKSLGLPTKDLHGKWIDTGTWSNAGRVSHENKTRVKTENIQTALAESQRTKSPKKIQNSSRKSGKK